MTEVLIVLGIIGVVALNIVDYKRKSTRKTVH